MMRKGRSVVVPSASTPPHGTGRPSDGRESRDVREGDRGFDHSGPGLSDARDGRVGDLAGDPGAQEALDPFRQFDEFESSFGEFESASDASGVAMPNVDAHQPVDRFERTSTLRANRSADTRDRFQRSSEARAEGASSARSTAAGASQRPVRSLKGRALAYLSRREYSRAELSRKLMPFADDADALELLLDALVRDGWLSDARFAESVIHRRAARLGATRIVSELKRHAVGDTLIEEVNAQLRETELARARAVWRKKYGQLPESPAERARQARFLAARGFSMTIIGKILKGADDDWSEN